MGVLGNFQATDEERFALQTALEHNCTCAENPEKICPAHMLIRNTVAIKYLIFVRRNFCEYPGLTTQS